MLFGRWWLPKLTPTQDSLPPSHTWGKWVQPQVAPTPQLPLTLFAVMSVLVQPVPILASAQVAPERVDTLLLAAAIVFGTLVLVCWNQWTLLRRAASFAAVPQGSEPAQQ